MIFILPFTLWHFTSDVVSYFRYGAPAGQLWYVFSKLFALYAVLLLWYQGLSTLLKDTHYSTLFSTWGFLRHRIIGCLTLLLIVSHIVCFVTAVSLRKETFAWGLLLPDFQDFYHMAISIGLFGFFTLLIAISAALLRERFPSVWKMTHRSMILVVGLGLVHGYLIGTETRYGLYEIFYCALIVTLLIALLLRWQVIKSKSI
ncbi:MAG: ferric reductase-like transmembrane domain-containing protein [Ectothiorhodospiraceae bacterium]|nr:ferric reductase-like transmembrane domain-containing protein [Ectothiorhodospiraceae bacterium]